MTAVSQRRNKSSLEQKQKFKLSKISCTANKLLWFLLRPTGKCGPFLALWLLPLYCCNIIAHNHFASSLTQHHPTVEARHTWLTVEEDTENSLILSGKVGHVMGQPCFAVDQGRRKVGALTFCGRSRSRFYRLGWGIHTVQRNGGGETGDFQGRKEGVYCKWKTKHFRTVIMELVRIRWLGVRFYSVSWSNSKCSSLSVSKVLCSLTLVCWPR